MIPTREKIMAAVCRHYETTPEEVASSNVTRRITEARHVFAWFCRRIRGDVYSAIQADVGLRTHGPLISGIEEAQARYAKDLGCGTRERVNNILEELGYDAAAIV